jgi:hypothetical protein
MWVFITNITNEFILGLGIRRAYGVSVDFGCQTLRLTEEELSLWSPGVGPRPSSLAVAKDQVIPAKCKGILMARLESPLKVESDLVEQSPKAHPPKGIYIARTLVQDRQEEATVKTSGAMKERHRKRNITSEHSGQPEKWSRGICGARKELVVTSSKMTRHAGVAWQEGNFV